MLEKPRREGNLLRILVRASIKRATEEASKTKTRATIPSSNPTPRCPYEKNTFQKDTGTPTFTAKLLTTAKACKHPNCPSTHPVDTEGMLAFLQWTVIQLSKKKKKKEIMSPAVTWMDLEMITLSKRDKYPMISLIGNIQKCGYN